MSGTSAISTTETWAVIRFFFLQGKAPKEIHVILTETLACFLPGRAKDLSAPLYNIGTHFSLFIPKWFNKRRRQTAWLRVGGNPVFRNLVQFSGCPDRIFVVLLSTWTKVMGYCLILGHDHFFYIRYDLLFSNHPISLRYIIEKLTASLIKLQVSK